MPHPALQQTSRIAGDIFPSVFDWIFTHPVFRRWRDSRVSWQLHCIGYPGAGKTTLTSLIHQHLQGYFKTQPFPIVPIYIDRDVLDFETSFIEDFFDMIFVGLGTNNVHENDTSQTAYEEYKRERVSLEPPRTRDRLRRLRTALRLRLHAFQGKRAFLLLDGIDRCSQTIRMLLDDELCKLLDMGLSMLVTSRLPDLEQEEVGCDHPDHGVQPDDTSTPLDYQPILDMFLECNECQFLLCFPCRDQKRYCDHGHDHSHLVEPYDHVNINVRIPEEPLKDFIAWNLETEHGDLGLGSSARKPPLSNLGKSLVSNTASKSAQLHADNVYDYAEGHIGLAKARLDLIHNMTSLEDVETRRDQLPVNIVAMFDSGLKCLQDRPAGHGKIAVRAIAAASFGIYGEEIPKIRDLLRNMDAVEIRGGEDITEATRGFLIASKKVPREVAAFHSSFFYYIAQRYNQAIHHASMEIKTRLARLEQNTMSHSPVDILPNELFESSPMQPVEESFQPFIIRKGTRAWQ